MTNKIEIIFGIGEDRNGIRLSHEEQQTICETIQHHAATQFGGYTMIDSSGGWVDSFGKLIQEPGKILVLITTEPIKTAKEFAAWIRSTARQSCVSFSVTEIEHELI